MPSKVVIPKRISKTVRSFGLSRNLVVGLFNRIYGDLPSASRAVRTDDQREFVFQISMLDAGTRHFFKISVDDATAPDHLIVRVIRHVTEADL